MDEFARELYEEFQRATGDYSVSWGELSTDLQRAWVAVAIEAKRIGDRYRLEDDDPEGVDS